MCKYIEFNWKSKRKLKIQECTMNKNKRYKRKIKRLEKQRDFFTNYANNLENEYYKLNNENNIVLIIAIIELIIILFKI